MSAIWNSSQTLWGKGQLYLFCSAVGNSVKPKQLQAWNSLLRSHVVHGFVWLYMSVLFYTNNKKKEILHIWSTRETDRNMTNKIGFISSEHKTKQHTSCHIVICNLCIVNILFVMPKIASACLASVHHPNLSPAVWLWWSRDAPCWLHQAS